MLHGNPESRIKSTRIHKPGIVGYNKHEQENNINFSRFALALQLFMEWEGELEVVVGSALNLIAAGKA
jgi:hypothetical protein